MDAIEDRLGACSPTDLLGELFERAPCFMNVTRGPMHIEVMSNNEFHRMMGRRPVLGRSFAENFPELAAQGLLAIADRVFATGEQYVNRNLRVEITIDGEPTELVVDFTVQRLAKPDSGTDDVMCFGYDVTERVREQERAARLQRELNHASQGVVMSAMAATLAYELNQPLAAASNYLGAARLASATPPAAIGLAEAQIRRAGEIIRRARTLLTASHPARERVPVRDMIAEAMQMLDACGLFHDTVVHVELEDPEVEVQVDRVQIEQVLINALRNASQAMAQSADKALELRSHREDSVLVLNIIDSGRGLSSAINPFGTFESASGGLGIGLSISKTIVEAHGGTIDLADNDGAGATLSIRLPTYDTRFWKLGAR